MPFRFLEHPADIRVECSGKNLEDLLVAAAEALYSIALNKKRTESSVRFLVSFHATHFEEILVRWLQELIYLLDRESFVATSFEFQRISTEEVEVGLGGYRCSPEEREVEVKAATYHGLEMEHTPFGITARVILDI